MRLIKYFTLLLSLLLCSQAFANQTALQDGLYIKSEKDGTAVSTLDGQQIYINEKFTDSIGKVTLRSMNNDNSSYYLHIESTDTFSQQHSEIALYVKGYTLQFKGGGSMDGKVTNISGWFDSQEAAEAFAKYFKITPILRIHPKHVLSVKYVPSKEKFLPGDPLMVKLEIKNLGKNPVSFQVGGRNRGKRDNQFAFMAKIGGQAVKDTGSGIDFGGKSYAHTLKPNETFTKDVDLSKWFTLTASGTYEMIGTYLLEFKDPNMEEYFTTWQDYATAYFYIAIKETMSLDRAPR